MKSARQFSIHYTREEARELLPQVQVWLDRLVQLQEPLAGAAGKVEELLSHGQDCGGPTIERYLGIQSEFLEFLSEFKKRQILIKDVNRGLVDFPSILDGREVFLCWEQGETDIEFWHELDAGYAGRERL